MELTKQERALKTTAYVVYGLMTGLFESGECGSAYDGFFPDEFSVEGSPASNALSELHHTRNRAVALLNELENMGWKDDCRLFEPMTDASLSVLREYLQKAFIRGYSMREESKLYSGVCQSMAEAKERFAIAGDTKNLGAAELDKMKAAIDEMVSSLEGKAMAYGMAFADGAYPLLQLGVRDVITATDEKPG